MNKIIENLKSGNYEVVDNQGVSVTENFTQCLEKEFEDLEIKLAESEREADQRYKDWQEEIRECDGLRVVLSEVRKQLADTEEQNKRVLEKLELIVRANQELEQKLAESKNSLKRTIEHYEKYCSEINHQNVMLYASACNAQQASRDKISFCIEQLEKVKEFFLEEHRDEEMDTDYIITKDVGEIADYLLNQIKQLKEGE